jgi:hypothetical protein
MTRKTIGYVELEWTCPNCANKNPGMKKSCGTCGSPQPESVQFELGQNQDLIKDAQKTASAAKEADIQCPFCDTRNAADAQVCVQCGGDLKAGVRRESGRVISGAPMNTNTPITCPGCGTRNPPGSTTCSACGISLAKPRGPAGEQSTEKPGAFRPWMLLPVGAVLMMVCVVVGYFLFRNTALIGVVQKTEWQRAIAIEAQREVTKQDWRDQLPAGAKILACQQEYRSRQENPVTGARQVCTTQLVDQGNGAARVDETCYYEIYADYCKYQALEWQTVDRALAEGSDLQPHWPQVNPASGQRAGVRSETYTAYFDTKDGNKQFATSNAALFAQFQPGSEWILSVNTLGAVVDVSPP